MGSVGLLTARVVTRQPDIDAVLAAVRSEWSAHEGVPALPAGGVSELLGFFDGLVRAHTDLLRDLEQRVAPRYHQEEELASILARSRAMLEATFGARQQAHDSWLALRRVASRDEYAVALARRREISARVAERLAAGALPESVEGRALLRRELEAKLAKSELVPPDPDRPSEVAVVKAQQQINRLQRECQEIGAHQTELEMRRSALEARAGLGVTELSAAMSALEAEQQAIAQDLRARRLEKQSAAAAAALFSELASRKALHLDLLADSIGESLAACGLAGVEVKLEGLREADLSVSDVGGEVRPITVVAAARRDLTVLAARLALAERLVDPASGPLVVLEEPFARMRREWLGHAMRLIAGFQRRTGWQVVVITRDAETAAALADESSGAGVIDLDAIGAEIAVAVAA
jgi:hypothetical protein